MIYELRTYQCIPGKLPALLKRFETKTLDVWKKHGIRPTGFWTVLIGDGYGEAFKSQPDVAVGNLSEAVAWILRQPARQAG